MPYPQGPFISASTNLVQAATGTDTITRNPYRPIRSVRVWVNVDFLGVERFELPLVGNKVS